MIAPLDESANGGWSGGKNADFIFFDQLPEAAFVGEVRRALVHENCRACGERAINHVRVAGYPADVGSTPEDIISPMVKDPLECFLGEEIVTGRCVLDAFWL